jgi:hypothetical protein
VVLQDFLGVIYAAESMGTQLNPIDQTLFVVMLVESAKDIDRDSHLLFLMAKTYFDISNKYMIDQIAGMAGLLSLQNDAARDTYVKEVANESRATSTKVKDLAAERQRQYELVNFNRQEQYMEFIREGMIQGVVIGRR